MDKEKFREIARDVESEWGFGGLSDGLYYDYAFEIAKRYIKARHLSSSSSGAAGNCPRCGKPLIMGVCETGCGHIPPPA